MKAMQKTIVMSCDLPPVVESDARTAGSGTRRIDCWRAVRVSDLPAEMIRDQALAVSGLLVERTGGPSVKPYQPPGLWQELAGGHGYVQDHGDSTVPPQPVHLLEANRGAAIDGQLRLAHSRDLHRPRSAHQHAAAGSRSDERRHVRGSGAQTCGAHDDGRRRQRPEARIAYAYRLVLARAPKPAEEKILLAALDEFRKTICAAIPASAAKLVVGGRVSPQSSDSMSRELAAYTSVASMLLNLDETITKE